MAPSSAGAGLDPRTRAQCGTGMQPPARAPTTGPPRPSAWHVPVSARSSAPGQSPAGAPAELERGSHVWYMDRSGSWLAGTVTFVDRALQPPAYQVRLDRDGQIRDTELSRLRKREVAHGALGAGVMR